MIFAAAHQNGYTLGRNDTPIDRIVVHTMVGTLAGTVAHFASPGAKVSAHYSVGLDGSLVQHVYESDTAYHAGAWPMNLRAIGIEHEDAGDPTAPRPAALYAASARLIAAIAGRWGIPIDSAHVIPHREVSATACPGALDVGRLITLAQGGTMFTDEQRAEVQRIADAAAAAAVTAYGQRLQDELVESAYKPIAELQRRQSTAGKYLSDAARTLTEGS